MAERAHPDDPAFQGTIYEQRLHERYARCQPFILNKDVLDVPCGTGWGTSLLSGYRSLTGVDNNAEAISYAQSHYPQIRFVIGPMEALPLDDHCYDVIVCLEGLEHIYRSHAEQFLHEAYRVLRADGLCVLTVPLRTNGRHSNNPYHLYEYEQQELEALLERFFILEQSSVTAGGDSNELFVVGRRRAQIAPASIAIPSQHFQHVLRWLLGLQTEQGFRYAANKPATIISTACAVLILESIGNLDHFSPEQRQKLIHGLQDCQDQVTGLFIEPLLEEFPISSKEHDSVYIAHQSSYFAIQALDALGAKPRYKLQFMQQFNTVEVLAAWMQELNWSNAWLQSNRVMFMLAFLIYQAEIELDSNAPVLFHSILDWLDQHQDFSTGLWGIQQGASQLNAVAAAYHFIPFYEYVHRPVSHIKAIIDATLGLQQTDGLFGPETGGGACEDLDAIDLLAIFTGQVKYRNDEIKNALLRAFWAIWNMQNSDGGFPYASRQNDDIYRFSSWSVMEAMLRESDVWATWFRLLALATIQATYTQDTPPLGDWVFRRWPALGYHRSGKALHQSEQETLPLWIRPTAYPHSKTDDRPQTPPVISVIIPCYNLGRYLHEALESVLAQSFQELEIIVVDDGSTDPFTCFLLDRLERPKTQLIRQSNHGVAAARNHGIRISQGEYICCLDADDRLRSRYFEETLKKIQANPRVAFVSTYYQEFNERRGIISYESCDLPDMLVTNHAIVSSLFRRSVWQEIGGYSEALSGLHDWDLWIGMLAAGYHAAVVPEILFEYRIREDSMYGTSQRPENFSKLVGIIVDRHRSVYERCFPEVITGWAHEFAGLVLYANGQSQLALQTGKIQLQLDNALQQLAITHSMIRGFEFEQTNLQTIIEQRGAWISELEASRDYYIQQSKNWQSEVHFWQQQAQELEKYHAGAVEEGKVLRSDRDALTAERDALTAERDALTAERDALTAERDALTAERDALLRYNPIAQVQRKMRKRQLAKLGK